MTTTVQAKIKGSLANILRFKQEGGWNNCIGRRTGKTVTLKWTFEVETTDEAIAKAQDYLDINLIETLGLELISFTTI